MRSYAYPHADANPNRNANAYPYANRDAYSHALADAYPYANAYPYSRRRIPDLGERTRRPERRRTGNPGLQASGQRRRPRRPPSARYGPVPHHVVRSHLDAYPNANAYAPSASARSRRGSNRDAYAYAYPNRDANAYPHAYPYADPNSYAYPDA